MKTGLKFFLMTGLVFLTLAASAQAAVKYVKAGASGSGASWADAGDLQTILTGSASGDEIWVAKGTYTPGSARTASFILKTGVALYGGFAGTETALSERDWRTNETILSGDIDSNDPDISGNSYHVVTGSGTNNTAIIDGFTITAGYADGTIGDDGKGGGMLNNAGSPTVRNIIFSENSGLYGGGMANLAASSPAITNTSFIGNFTTFYDGGGMYNNGSSPTLTNVVFSGNKAFRNGGGISNEDNSSPTITNVTFSGNRAQGSGGGAVFNNFSSPKIYNSILWNNSSGIVDVFMSTTVANSIVQGGFTGATDADPLFVTPVDSATAPTTAGDLHVQSGSPAINAGDDSKNSEPEDLDGKTRKSGTIDMGAYEYPPPEIDIWGKEVSIPDNSTTPSSTDDTDFGSVDIDAVGAVHTFTIKNTGNAELKLTGSPLVVLSNSAFTLTQTPDSTIAAGSSTTFQITFDPSAVQNYESTVIIANNDPDESSYTFKIKGNGTKGAEIDILSNDNSIVNEDTTPDISDNTDFGSLNISNADKTQTFVIKNTGQATLNLTGSPIVQITGTNASDFSVTQPSVSSIAPASSVNFEITFDPETIGIKTAQVLIENDDTDESSYTFAIKGTGGTDPEIDVTGNSNSIANNDETPDTSDNTDFGDVVTGDSLDHTFVIKNLGSSDLTISDVRIMTESNPGDFSIIEKPEAAEIVAPGSSANIKVRLTPSTLGSRTAKIFILSNDGDEEQYLITIQGSGVDGVARGDINNDNQLDLKDTILVLKLLAGVDMTGETINLGADVNSDGKIGIEEAIFILQKIAE